MKPKRILLIDDDHTTNALNKMIISRSALVDEVLTFEEAEKALTFLKNENGSRQPSLILLDINMPIMDGWEFLSEYDKLNGSNRNDKIVLLTSSIDPEDMSKAEELASVSEFRSKPLSTDMLDSLVTDYFN